MAKRKSEEVDMDLDEAEIAKRRDDAIRRALNTLPQPQNAMPKKRSAKAKADAAEGPPKAARP